MPGGADFGLSQIGQISMNVHDLHRAIEFYRDSLGIKHLFTVPKMAFFDCAGTRLMLAIPMKLNLTIPVPSSTSRWTTYKRPMRPSSKGMSIFKGNLT